MMSRHEHRASQRPLTSVTRYVGALAALPMSAGFVLALAILTAVGWLTLRNLNIQAEADRLTVHTYLVIQKLETLVSDLKDLESGERGYAITGDEKYLESLANAKRKVTTDHAELQIITKDNGDQQRRLAEIELLIRRRLAETERRLQLRKEKGLAAAPMFMTSNTGTSLMGQIHRLITEAQSEEEQLLKLRLGEEDRSRNSTLQGLLAGNIISFVILASIFFLLNQENRRRKRVEGELRQERDRLEEAVAERTAGLSREVEERRQAEMALRQSEERFRTLADNIPQLCWMANAEGWIFWYNRRWYEYTGTTPEQMEGWGWQSVHDPETLPQVVERWRESITTGKPFDMVFPLRAADGIFRPFLTRVMPVLDQDGMIVRWFGTNTDISEQKRVEEELASAHAQSEAGRRRLEIILETSPVGVVLVEAATGSLSLVNRRAVEIYGTGYDGVDFEAHLTQVNALLPDGSPFLAEQLPANRALRGEQVHNTELTIVRPDGTRVPLSVNAAPLRSAEGAVTAAVVLFDDITERKEAEQELENLARQRQLALDAAHMGWWHYDPITKIASWDDGYKKIFDVTDYSRPNEEILTRIHPEDLPGVWAKVEAALDPVDPKPYLAEYRICLPDGSLKWIEAHGTASFSGTGEQRQATSFVGTVADITERKQAEEALHKVHIELAIQMEERIRELQEKEVLLKEVHHRVKNNLQIISSLVGLQANESRDETVREGLQEVVYRVRSMALVHEKLYQSADLANIDFAEYVRSLLQYLWRAHGKTDATVRLQFDLAPVTLPVDTAVPCGLILNELAGNTLKHAFRGCTEGDVTVTLRDGGDGQVVMGIRDNGVGLPPDLDWRQANSLGLRLVQMLVKQLQAEVTVGTGMGTSFEITFSPGVAKHGKPLSA